MLFALLKPELLPSLILPYTSSEVLNSYISSLVMKLLIY